MKTSSLLLGVAAVLLLGVPVVVGAQQAPVAARPGDRSVPRFVGGSGRALPPGGLEVVQAGPGAGISRGGGPTTDLGADLGRVLEGVDGALLQGPCEVAAAGGVSFFLTEGSSARVVVGPDGSITLTLLTGSAFARNTDLLLRVGTGGSLTAGPTGRFTGVQGPGSASPGSGGAWVSFFGTGALDEVIRALEDLSVYQRTNRTQGAVSTSRPFR